MNNYPDEATAQVKADGQNAEKTVKWFCPLIKDGCRKDCICYREAYVRRTTADKYAVQANRCSNAIL